MTHFNHQTNGASLEDCHTNFFALTDLCGIKWRKLVWGENATEQTNNGQAQAQPLDDPVLSSYCRCLANDILCVWRRVSSSSTCTSQNAGAGNNNNNLFDLGMSTTMPAMHTQPPPLSLVASKELWIFWYGEEPDLSTILAPELSAPDGEQGSWESGLSYECRSLLFKALHNLIERCLLSRDFIKLGKWFVQPSTRPVSDDAGSHATSSTHFSFSFAFFVHGESTVCASVDVRRHPAVQRLTRRHLHNTHTNSTNTPVILAPFGLAGVLTGNSYRATDWSNRILDDWQKFFPLDQRAFTRDADAAPPLVDVLVGEYKMKYPACYVLVTDNDDVNLSAQSDAHTANSSGGGGGGGTQVPAPSASSSAFPPSPPVSPPPPCQIGQIPFDISEFPESVWQECVHGPNQTNDSIDDTGWTFADPFAKHACACNKSHASITSTVQTQRADVTVASHNSVDASPNSIAAPSPLNPGSQAPSGSTNVQVATPSGGGSKTLNPDIHVNSPMMTNLHVNASNALTSNVETPPASIEANNNSTTSLSSSTLTQQATTRASHAQSQPTTTSSNFCTSAANSTAAANATDSTHLAPASLKRPVLPMSDAEAAATHPHDDDANLNLLYDYTSMEAWLNHPVKRFRGDQTREKRVQNGSLYAVKRECEDDGASGGGEQRAINDPFGVRVKTEDESRTASDPYNFDESTNDTKPTLNHIKEEKDIKQEFDSSAFDQIFSHSDADANADEVAAAIQVHTPPASNKSINDETQTKRGLSCLSNASAIRPEELSQMFPTPPSMEHNPIASPCPNPLDGVDMLTDIVIKQEGCYPLVESPLTDGVNAIDDWSYVFRPPSVYVVAGSSKYTPLTNLPSHSLPPIVLPPHCVYKPSWRKNVATGHVGGVTTNTPTNTNNQLLKAPQSVGTPNPRRTGNLSAPVTPGPMTPVSCGGTAPGQMTPIHQTCPQPMSSLPLPPPYELPSPANSTSSYVNKALNSVDPSTPAGNRTHETSATTDADSLVINILLGDTALNIFRDHNFDSCTLCVCNAGPKCVGNIRGADSGMYLITPWMLNQSSTCANGSGDNSTISPVSGMMTNSLFGGQSTSPIPFNDDDQIRCTCGFSAIVNRRLGYRSGLFYEDELEITGITQDPAERKKPSLTSGLAAMGLTELVGDGENVDDKLSAIPSTLIEMLREQCVIMQSDSNALHRAAKMFRNSTCTNINTDQTKLITSNNINLKHVHALLKTTRNLSTLNVLEFIDGNEITALVLDSCGGGAAKPSGLLTTDVNAQTTQYVHKWPFIRAAGPHCNQDIVRVMKALQPLLQDAIQNKCTTRLWDAPYTVSGPLTWRQFHRLAGRGTDYRCEPQPIPSIIVGHEKDWLSISPYAIHQWDKLLLEPYSYARDIAYVVVVPDNDAIVERAKRFFKDLSTAYEVCKLGKHQPLSRVWRDGVLRVNRATKAKFAAASGGDDMDEWFALLGDGKFADMVKLYAQVCRQHLAAHLSQMQMDRTLFDPPDGAPSATHNLIPTPVEPRASDCSNMNQTQDEPASNTVMPNTNQPPPENATPNQTALHNVTFATCNFNDDDDTQSPPSIVVYFVEPFTMETDRADLHRLACLALLRCCGQMLNAIPEHVRQHVSVQLISLESVLELGTASSSNPRAAIATNMSYSTQRNRNVKHNDHMRALALNVFSQCRRKLVHTANVKSLTGFGTAAMADLFLKNKDEKNRAPYKLYTPPYILAPLKDKAESAESFGQINSEECSIMYVSYCLSDDQSWLLAVATDERGELIEPCVINIDVPNRSRRKKASARRVGLQRLMDFILGLMSQSVGPWRLVIGRIGRVGHGELKGWSWLLSRKWLSKASKQLKEICEQCALMYPNGTPCILSACLVSTESDSALRVMPDQFTPDERFSQTSVNCQLSTPHDVSCTHILVFPTSATAQSSQTAFQEQHINGPELGDDELLYALNDADEIMPDGIDGMNDFNDIFNTWPETGGGGGPSPSGSPRRDGGSPNSHSASPNGMGGGGDGGAGGFCSMDGMGMRHANTLDCQEEVGTVLQQPLALGYLVSTAPTGRMPAWFWASCPHLESVSPTFLKNALHLHSPSIQQNSDDLLQQQTSVTAHPLDSQFTTDVLRYVLEGYNALSWLTFDENTHDRLSCLPVHMQMLMQLYHLTSSLL